MTEYKSATNENGLSVEIIYNSEDYNPMMGCYSSNPSWEQYLNDYKEEYRPHVLLLKQVIEENGLIGMNGSQQNNMSFKFSDGQHWGFTWRAWGDLMQAIVDKNEGYMAYYM